MDAPANMTAAAGQGTLPLDAGSLFVLLTTVVVFIVPLLMLFPPCPPSKSDALNETHNKLGPEPGVRRGAAAPGTAGPGRVESLFVYPVATCRGVELSRAKVVPGGLEFDGLFTLAQLVSPFPASSSSGESAPAQRKHRWVALASSSSSSSSSPPRQQQFPRLRTGVEVELWRPDLAKIKGFRDVTAGSSGEVFLLLRFPWREEGLMGLYEAFAAKCSRGWRAQPVMEMLLPVGPPSEAEVADRGYQWEKVQVGEDEITALNMGCELPEELRLYLGVSNKLALFRIDPEQRLRVADAEEAGSQPASGFLDRYPVHVMNLASIRDQESNMTKAQDLEKLGPQRFRTNILVSGLPSHDEDGWKKIKFRAEGAQQQDEATFHVSCRTTDKTLTADHEVNEGVPKAGCLDMQMKPLFEETESPQTFVEVGMSIEVLERGEHTYKKQ